MRAFVVLLLLLAHLLYAAGAAMAFLDFKEPGSSGTWTGFLYLVITAVLGFPWSVALWLAGSFFEARWTLWLAFIANYLILWRITFAGLAWFGGEKSDVATAEPHGLSTGTKLRVGVFLPLAVWGAYQVLLLGSIPEGRWEREGLLIASVAVLPAMAAANWWVVFISFSDRRKAFLVGLALPACIAIFEYIWSTNSGVFATMPLVLRPLIVVAFFVPFLFSLIYFSVSSSRPSSISAKSIVSSRPNEIRD